MDTTLEEAVADAKREREIIAQNLLRCINALQYAPHINYWVVGS